MQRPLPDLGPRGEGYVAIQSVLFLAIALAGLFGPAWSGRARVATALVGVALIAGGALLALRGALDLGKSLTVVPRPLDRSTLVERGAYAVVRHPIYGGLVVASVGWGLATASPLALVAGLVLGVFFDLKSRREEGWLEERYPDYPAYRSRTRRLIPWLY